MSDIFISYASKDRDRAEIIAKALSDHGWAVWWDRTIPAGQTFGTVIEEALAEAKCIMVLWSVHSVSSNWVQEEAEEGRKKAILIPVFIEKVRPPMGFRSFQAADLTDWDRGKKTPSYEKLIADITNVIGPPPKREKSVQDTKVPESTLEQHPRMESPTAGPKTSRKKWIAARIGVGALILIICIIVWFLTIKPKKVITDQQNFKPNKVIKFPKLKTIRKTEFTVVLASVGDKKIQVIKEVRAITGLGLREAKALVDRAPKEVKKGVSKKEAEKIKKILTDAGATVEIK